MAAATAMANKEHQEAGTAKVQDRSVMAAIICAIFVEASLKSPKSADFPWDKAAGEKWAVGDQMYKVRSYVEAKNSFGAELRNLYKCTIQYQSVAHQHCLSVGSSRLDQSIFGADEPPV